MTTPRTITTRMTAPSLAGLNRTIRGCTSCRLYNGARTAVPGEGPVSARVFLIGQAPGRTEDVAGRPFIGRAGRYLSSVLARHGIDREELFITSVVKHMPPHDRMPRSDEVAACIPYLVRQLRIVNPEIVVLMGALARKQAPRISATYIETVHPAAAMRFPKMAHEFEHGIAQLRREMG